MNHFQTGARSQSRSVAKQQIYTLQPSPILLGIGMKDLTGILQVAKVNTSLQHV